MKLKIPPQSREALAEVVYDLFGVKVTDDNELVAQINSIAAASAEAAKAKEIDPDLAFKASVPTTATGAALLTARLKQLGDSREFKRFLDAPAPQEPETSEEEPAEAPKAPTREEFIEAVKGRM